MEVARVGAVLSMYFELKIVPSLITTLTWFPCDRDVSVLFNDFWIFHKSIILRLGRERISSDEQQHI